MRGLVHAWDLALKHYTLNGLIPVTFEARHAWCGDSRGVEIRAVLTTPCRVTGEPIKLSVRAFETAPPDDQVVEQIVRYLAREIYDHERKEWLQRDGKCVDDPHPELRAR